MPSCLTAGRKGESPADGLPCHRERPVSHVATRRLRVPRPPVGSDKRSATEVVPPDVSRVRLVMPASRLSKGPFKDAAAVTPRAPAPRYRRTAAGSPGEGGRAVAVERGLLRRVITGQGPRQRPSEAKAEASAGAPDSGVPPARRSCRYRRRAGVLRG